VLFVGAPARATAREPIIPQFSASDIVAIEDECQNLYPLISELWKKEGEKLKTLLSEDKGLSRAAGRYRGDDLVELFAGMDAFALEGHPFSVFDGFYETYRK